MAVHFWPVERADVSRYSPRSESSIAGVASSEADKNFKADFLDSIASGLRANATTVVTADDVAKIVCIWSPNDGSKWQQLAGSLGALASNALESAGQSQALTIVENMAMGLNNAAAQARTEVAAQ